MKPAFESCDVSDNFQVLLSRQSRVMTKENDRGNLRRHGPGLGPGTDRGRGHGRGHGRGSGHGRGHVPRGKVFGGRGQGRGRVSDAIYRSEHCSGSSAGSSRFSDDSAPNSAESIGSSASLPRKQPPLNGLHELLLEFRNSERGYICTNKNVDQVPPAVGSTNRRGGQLSWANMRRQYQRSNSTADSSSEPDGYHRTLQNVCGPDGGWGGKGRGRLLDPSSVIKPGSDVDNNVWSGRGRGGILFVPGVDFHSAPNSTRWKHYGTSDQGMLKSRHSFGGCATNYAVQSSQLFTAKGDVTDHSGKHRYQKWRKKTGKDNECNNGPTIDNCVKKQVTSSIPPAVDDKKLLYQRKHSNVKNIEENLQKQLIIRTDDAVHVNLRKSVLPVNTNDVEENLQKQVIIMTGDAVHVDMQKTKVPVNVNNLEENLPKQLSTRTDDAVHVDVPVNVNNVEENLQKQLITRTDDAVHVDIPVNVNDVEANLQKQLITRTDDAVHADVPVNVNNVEENLQKQRITRTDDAVRVDMQMAVVPVNCSSDQKSDRKEYCKPGHLSPRGGRTRGIVLFGGSLFTKGGTLDTRNTVVCGRDIEKKPSAS